MNLLLLILRWVLLLIFLLLLIVNARRVGLEGGTFISMLIGCRRSNRSLHFFAITNYLSCLHTLDKLLVTNALILRGYYKFRLWLLVLSSCGVSINIKMNGILICIILGIHLLRLLVLLLFRIMVHH